MTLSRLRPMELTLQFQDQRYALGDSIQLQIDLKARRNVTVRELRVDLLCEETYVESYTVMMPDRSNISAQGRVPGGFYVPPPPIPKLVKEEHRETYVHSSVVVLGEKLFQTDMTDSYSARLEIADERPPHATTATLKWRLEAVATWPWPGT